MANAKIFLSPKAVISVLIGSTNPGSGFESKTTHPSKSQQYAKAFQVESHLLPKHLSFFSWFSLTSGRILHLSAISGRLISTSWTWQPHEVALKRHPTDDRPRS